MKKTRLLAFLITVCLATTCFLTSTVAKYSTSDAAADQGTVAKWGIVVSADGSLFGKQYAQTANTIVADEDTFATLSVKNTTGNTMAPGTKNETGMTFVVDGTAEVMVDITFTVKSSNGDSSPVDVFLGAGTYTDYTDVSTDKTFEIDEEGYYPVIYTLKQKTDNDATAKTIVTGNLAAIEEYFENLNQSNKNIAVGTDLGKTYGTYELTWEWAFSANDAADTLLGMLSQDSDTETGATDPSYSVTTDFVIEIKVEQVD